MGKFKLSSSSCPHCYKTKDPQESTYTCNGCGSTFGHCCKDELKECEGCGEYFCEDCLDENSYCDDCQFYCTCENCGTRCEDEDEEGSINGFNSCEKCGNMFCRLCYVVTFKEERNRSGGEYEFYVHCEECYLSIKLKEREERDKLIGKKAKVEKD